MTVFTPDVWPQLPGPDVSSHMPCDGRAVGIIITCGDRLLLSERTAVPAGLTPVASHMDAQEEPQTAAVVETWKQVGLRLHAEDLTVVCSSWRPGMCLRIQTREGSDAVPAGGHHWTVFTAEALGDLNLNEEQVRRSWWMTPVEVAERALLTCQWAVGEVDDDAAFGLAPALESVWVRAIAQWFLANDHARLAMPLTRHLDRIDALWTPRDPGTR